MAIGTSYAAIAEAAAKAAALAAGEVVVKEDVRPEHLYTHYKEFDRYKAVFRNQKSVLGGTRALFTPEFVAILEEALLRDNVHVMGKEQQAYFDKYCAEAQAHMDMYPNGTYNTGQYGINTAPAMSESIKQFDEFLGSYKEEIEV